MPFWKLLEADDTSESINGGSLTPDETIWGGEEELERWATPRLPIGSRAIYPIISVDSNVRSNIVRIEQAHLDGSYDILLRDGSSEMNVPGVHLRPLEDEDMHGSWLDEVVGVRSLEDDDTVSSQFDEIQARYCCT